MPLSIYFLYPNKDTVKYVFIIFSYIILLSPSKSYENKILFKVNNEIITSIDILEEIEYLKMINKNIPIYIHSYHTKFLKFKLERLGFKVNELIHGKKYSLSKYSNINIYAADNCNPKLCLKIMGCADLNAKNGSQQIDTLAVFDDGKNVLVNTNDCPFELAKSTLDQILKDYSDITGVLTGYSGAGHYPQCFKSISNKDKILIEFRSQSFLQQQVRSMVGCIKYVGEKKWSLKKNQYKFGR